MDYNGLKWVKAMSGHGSHDILMLMTAFKAPN